LFTKNEKEKVEHAYKTGFRNFYLSYVECQNDVDQFRELVKDSNIILKIENKKGLAFVDKSFKKQDNTQLAVGRGDLYVEVDRPHHILKAQKLIISKDPNAIVGSRMLLSLFNNDVPSCSDICEIGFLKSLGFKNFLLCDDLCKKESSQQRAIDTFTAIKNEL
jgi:pyruvate kinase